MKNRFAIYYFLFVTIFIGYFLTIQLKANTSPYGGIVTIPKILEMKSEIESIKKETNNLAASINESELTLKGYEEKMLNGDLKDKMQQELELSQTYADYKEMEGPGIIITMNDSVAEVGEGESIDWYVIHDLDMLNIINELRTAGAEAIAINDERVTATSNIRCGGPTINIDGKRHAVPFIIKAIGDPVALEASFTSPESYKNLLDMYEIRFDIQKVDKMVIPAYDGSYKLNYQKKIEGGE